MNWTKISRSHRMSDCPSRIRAAHEEDGFSVRPFLTQSLTSTTTNNFYLLRFYLFLV